MVFNSLGSNYNFGFATKALFLPSRKKDQDRLQKFLEHKYQGRAVLLYKGREAIALAMQILNLPHQSTVAINGYTCYAVYQPIVEAGYKIEYLDINKNDLNFSAAELLKKLEAGSQIKAVVVQNTLGYACDIAAIAEICREKNIVLIEDLAHSVGTVYKNGGEAGSFGDFVVLSFSQDKIIDAVSGGALIIRNKKYQNFELPALARIKKSKIIKDRFYPTFTWKIRTNYSWGLGKLDHKILKSLGLLSQPMGALEKIALHNLPGWYCALVLENFKNLENNLQHRKSIAAIYTHKLNPKCLIPQTTSQINNYSNLRFPILVEDRKSLINFLAKVGVHISDIWYDAPIAPQKYLTHTNYKGKCPEAEKISGTMLNLPTHINVSQKQAEKITQQINLWLQSK